MSILVRPSPYADELAMGYLLRLAESNALPSCSALGQTRGNTLTLIVRYRLKGPVAHLRGQSSTDRSGIPIRYWNVQRSRFCPQCLRDAPYWRSIWGLSLYTACPKHSLALVDQCSCGATATWFRTSLLNCACGFDYRDVVAAHAAAAPLKVSSLLEAAASTNSVDARSETASPLLHELQRLWLIGAHACGTGAKPKKLKALQFLDNARKVSEAIGEILLDWPAGFNRLLNTIADKRSLSTGNGLVSTFGSLYRDIFSSRTFEAYAPLRSAFECYVRTEWTGQLSRRNRRMPTQMVIEHEWVPALVASRELGCKTPIIRRAINTGQLVGHIHARPSGRTTTVVSRASLDRFKQARTGWIDLKASCARYGVGKKRLLQLISAKHLRPVQGPCVDGSSTWQFRPEDVRTALQNQQKEYPTVREEAMSS